MKTTTSPWIMKTISFGMLFDCIKACDACKSPKRSPAKAVPSAVQFPTNATAIPVTQ